MKIKIDENNFVIGYAEVGGGKNFIDIICDIPNDFETNFNSYKYENFKLVYYEEKQGLIDLEKSLNKELKDIIQWMEKTDYIVLKVARGNWQENDPRYLEYLAEYETKHARKEEIESILGV